MRFPAVALLAVVLASPMTAPVASAEDAGLAGKAASAEKTFLVPASEGYGVGECLTGGDPACGQVVANAWCESQGFASAASYGVADRDEYTGTIAAPTHSRTERPIRITCTD